MFQAQSRLTPFCGAFHNSSCAQTSRWKSLGQRHLETSRDRPDKTGFSMLEDHPLSSSVELFFGNFWIYGHYRCINETFATSPVMTLRLVSPLSLACSSIYSLCWFELDRALTLLPGNLSKDNMSKLKVWWIYVWEKSSHASWTIKSTWLPWRGQQSPIHNRGQGGPFHPLVTLTKLKVHASMFSGASEEKK